MRIVLLSPFAAERSALEQLLTDDGHDVVAAATHDEGLSLAAAAPPDAFVADAQVAPVDGIALVRALSARGIRPRVILLCPRASHAFEKDDVICLTKPIDLDELRRFLSRERTLEHRVA